MLQRQDVRDRLGLSLSLAFVEIVHNPTMVFQIHQDASYCHFASPFTMGRLWRIPDVHPTIKEKWRGICEKAAAAMISQRCEQISLADVRELPDAFFLLWLSAKGRDWKHQCPICLTEERRCDMFNPLRIFRPCGHSMCARSCAAKYLRKNQQCPVCRMPVVQSFDFDTTTFRLGDLMIESVKTTMFEDLERVYNENVQLYRET